MLKKKLKKNKSNRKRIKLVSRRGAVLDKGAIYVVVILTLLIFGAYILVGGTLPTQLPKASTNLVNVIIPSAAPTTSTLQMDTFYGVTPTPIPTRPPLSPMPTDSPNDPALVDCNRQIKGTQLPMIWGFTCDNSGPCLNPTKIKVFYNNDNPLLLGSGGVVSQMGRNPDSKQAPAIGNAVKDADGFLMYPSLFLTDVTALPNDVEGDSQGIGQANKPDGIYGTWKAAGAANPQGNPNNLGAGADPWPPANGPGGAIGNNYISEIAWNIPNLSALDPATKQFALLQPGHMYRVQIVLHDGATPSNVGVACFKFGMT